MLVQRTVCSLVLFLVLDLTVATSWHIDPELGDDVLYSGLWLGKPFKTLKRVVPELQPGDVVYVEGGSYTGQNVFLRNLRGGRTESSRITFKAVNGEVNLIQSQSENGHPSTNMYDYEEVQALSNSTLNGASIFIYNCTGITFEGFSISHTLGYAISVAKSTAIVLQGMTVSLENPTVNATQSAILAVDVGKLSLSDFAIISGQDHNTATNSTVAFIGVEDLAISNSSLECGSGSCFTMKNVTRASISTSVIAHADACRPTIDVIAGHNLVFVRYSKLVLTKGVTNCSGAPSAALAIGGSTISFYSNTVRLQRRRPLAECSAQSSKAYFYHNTILGLPSDQHVITGEECATNIEFVNNIVAGANSVSVSTLPERSVRFEGNCIDVDLPVHGGYTNQRPFFNNIRDTLLNDGEYRDLVLNPQRKVARTDIRDALTGNMEYDDLAPIINSALLQKEYAASSEQRTIVSGCKTGGVAITTVNSLFQGKQTSFNVANSLLFHIGDVVQAVGVFSYGWAPSSLTVTRVASVDYEKNTIKVFPPIVIKGGDRLLFASSATVSNFEGNIFGSDEDDSTFADPAMHMIMPGVLRGEADMLLHENTGHLRKRSVIADNSPAACGNGENIDGVCRCQEGWVGTYCSIRYVPSTPSPTRTPSATTTPSGTITITNTPSLSMSPSPSLPASGTMTNTPSPSLTTSSTTSGTTSPSMTASSTLETNPSSSPTTSRSPSITISPTPSSSPYMFKNYTTVLDSGAAVLPGYYGYLTKVLTELSTLQVDGILSYFPLDSEVKNLRDFVLDSRLEEADEFYVEDKSGRRNHGRYFHPAFVATNSYQDDVVVNGSVSTLTTLTKPQLARMDFKASVGCATADGESRSSIVFNLLSQQEDDFQNALYYPTGKIDTYSFNYFFLSFEMDSSRFPRIGNEEFNIIASSCPKGLQAPQDGQLSWQSIKESCGLLVYGRWVPTQGTYKLGVSVTVRDEGGTYDTVSFEGASIPENGHILIQGGQDQGLEVFVDGSRVDNGVGLFQNRVTTLNSQLVFGSVAFSLESVEDSVGFFCTTIDNVIVGNDIVGEYDRQLILGNNVLDTVDCSTDYNAQCTVRNYKLDSVQLHLKLDECGGPYAVDSSVKYKLDNFMSNTLAEMADISVEMAQRTAVHTLYVRNQSMGINHLHGRVYGSRWASGNGVYGGALALSGVGYISVPHMSINAVATDDEFDGVSKLLDDFTVAAWSKLPVHHMIVDSIHSIFATCEDYESSIHKTVFTEEFRWTPPGRIGRSVLCPLALYGRGVFRMGRRYVSYGARVIFSNVTEVAAAEVSSITLDAPQNSQITDSDWHHVAVSCRARRVCMLYIDGTLVESTSLQSGSILVPRLTSSVLVGRLAQPYRDDPMIERREFGNHWGHVDEVIVLSAFSSEGIVSNTLMAADSLTETSTFPNCHSSTTTELCSHFSPSSLVEGSTSSELYVGFENIPLGARSSAISSETSETVTIAPVSGILRVVPLSAAQRIQNGDKTGLQFESGAYVAVSGIPSPAGEYETLSLFLRLQIPANVTSGNYSSAGNCFLNEGSIPSVLQETGVEAMTPVICPYRLRLDVSDEQVLPIVTVSIPLVDSGVVQEWKVFDIFHLPHDLEAVSADGLFAGINIRVSNPYGTVKNIQIDSTMDTVKVSKSLSVNGEPGNDVPNDVLYQLFSNLKVGAAGAHVEDGSIESHVANIPDGSVMSEVALISSQGDDSVVVLFEKSILGQFSTHKDICLYGTNPLKGCATSNVLSESRPEMSLVEFKEGTHDGTTSKVPAFVFLGDPILFTPMEDPFESTQVTDTSEYGHDGILTDSSITWATGRPYNRNPSLYNHALQTGSTEGHSRHDISDYISSSPTMDGLYVSAWIRITGENYNAGRKYAIIGNCGVRPSTASALRCGVMLGLHSYTVASGGHLGNRVYARVDYNKSPGSESWTNGVLEKYSAQAIVPMNEGYGWKHIALWVQRYDISLESTRYFGAENAGQGLMVLYIDGEEDNPQYASSFSGIDLLGTTPLFVGRSGGDDLPPHRHWIIPADTLIDDATVVALHTDTLIEKWFANQTDTFPLPQLSMEGYFASAMDNNVALRNVFSSLGNSSHVIVDSDCPISGISSCLTNRTAVDTPSVSQIICRFKMDSIEDSVLVDSVGSVSELAMLKVFNASLHGAEPADVISSGVGSGQAVRLSAASRAYAAIADRSVLSRQTPLRTLSISVWFKVNGAAQLYRRYSFFGDCHDSAHAQVDCTVFFGLEGTTSDFGDACFSLRSTIRYREVSGTIVYESRKYGSTRLCENDSNSSWHHAILSVGSGSVRIYLDGTLDSIGMLPDYEAFEVVESEAFIGAAGNDSLSLWNQGRAHVVSMELSDLVIFKNELFPEDVLRLYEDAFFDEYTVTECTPADCVPRPARYSIDSELLVAHFPMDDTLASIAGDVSVLAVTPIAVSVQGQSEFLAREQQSPYGAHGLKLHSGSYIVGPAMSNVITPLDGFSISVDFTLPAVPVEDAVYHLVGDCKRYSSSVYYGAETGLHSPVLCGLEVRLNCRREPLYNAAHAGQLSFDVELRVTYQGSEVGSTDSITSLGLVSAAAVSPWKLYYGPVWHSLLLTWSSTEVLLSVDTYPPVSIVLETPDVLPVTAMSSPETSSLIDLNDHRLTLGSNGGPLLPSEDRTSLLSPAAYKNAMIFGTAAFTELEKGKIMEGVAYLPAEQCYDNS